jgi:hypothetical protein
VREVVFLELLLKFAEDFFVVNQLKLKRVYQLVGYLYGVLRHFKLQVHFCQQLQSFLSERAAFDILVVALDVIGPGKQL